MKLIIQIPCYNEQETIEGTLATLPRQVAGFDSVEWQIIDDGCKDATVERARAGGVDHVVHMNGNQGLARAFMAGLIAAVQCGADVIVNTDADNQYNSDDIHTLVRPILRAEADIVIGARPIQSIQHFSPTKRFLQHLGSKVVRTLSKTNVQDAPSGFRAISRDAALRLNVFNSYTYTLETIIQAGLSNLRIRNVPVRVNGPTRPSRLVKSIASYVNRGIMSMLSAYLIYKPVQIFSLLSAFFYLPAFALGMRYFYFMLGGEGRGHIQSVIAAAVFFMSGTFMLAIGIIAHLVGINRRLLEEIRYIEHSRNQGKQS